jgi:HAD superfamily hydrolase (TIGR01509 family)
MLKAVLLDLDNTLIDNAEDTFVRAYLQAAEQHFALPTQGVIANALMQAFARMAQLRDLPRTNFDVSLEVLAGVMQLPPTQVAAAFADFYTSTYSQLATLVRPMDGAADLIAFLRANHYAAVVATNPVYPCAAVLQRLAWAGLPTDSYALVTHAENTHFIKPHIAYYAEVLARVGVEPDQALMVGDHAERDIAPAAQLGLHTYHFDPAAGRTLHALQQQLASGALDDQPSSMALNVEGVLGELRGNVGALFGMLQDVKAHYWTQHPIPNEWSLSEIVCHLRDMERDAYRPQLQSIHTQDNPFIAATRTPPPPFEMACEVDGADVAQQFAAERQTTLAWLHTLHTDDWARKGRHSIFGVTSLLELAHFTAQHDRLHLNQLCRTLGRCE